jgi:hypothetical protein
MPYFSLLLFIFWEGREGREREREFVGGIDQREIGER